MVKQVERMMGLHKQLPKAKMPHDSEPLAVSRKPIAHLRQIAATDRQIDMLVYELYGLTEDEIAIVEGRAK